MISFHALDGGNILDIYRQVASTRKFRGFRQQEIREIYKFTGGLPCKNQKWKLEVFIGVQRNQ